MSTTTKTVCTTRMSVCCRLGLLLLLSAILALPIGCGKDDAGGGQPPQSRAGGPGGGNAPGKPEVQPVPVAVAPAVIGTIASYYNATATLAVEKEAEVQARVGGLVKTIQAEEGDQVAQDAPLLEIDNRQYRLRVDQAAALTANVRSRFERFEAMLAEDLTTPEEFQAAKSELASAEADEGLARLDLSYTVARAPFGGRVTRRLVNVGQNLSAGDPLFVLADFTPLLAQVHVPSREFKKLKQEQSVDLVLDSNGQKLKGRIKLVSPIIDPASGTIKITVEVDSYPAGTRPGDFAEVQIVTELRTGTLLVPREAVITEKGETIVFVAPAAAQDGPGAGKAERRPVTTGFIDERNTEILGGLEAGEQVVVKGQRSLKPGDPLKILADDQPAGAGS